MNETMVSRFRHGKIQVLISTDVLEEGIDIPNCNLIVRFDPAETFRSYVQARGRARCRLANYVFFTSSSEIKTTKENISTWHETEAVRQILLTFFLFSFLPGIWSVEILGIFYVQYIKKLYELK